MIINLSYAANLFYHLCNPKQTGRYSSTDALKHVWITNSKKLELVFSFDEDALLECIKSTMRLMIYCSSLRKISGINHCSKYDKGISEHEKIVQELKIMKSYEKQLKSMHENPKPYKQYKTLHRETSIKNENKRSFSNSFRIPNPKNCPIIQSNEIIRKHSARHSKFYTKTKINIDNSLHSDKSKNNNFLVPPGHKVIQLNHGAKINQV